jgi:hypothetical protein
MTCEMTARLFANGVSGFGPRRCECDGTSAVLPRRGQHQGEHRSGWVGHSMKCVMTD